MKLGIFLVAYTQKSLQWDFCLFFLQSHREKKKKLWKFEIKTIYIFFCQKTTYFFQPLQQKHIKKR
jgi:hypothetical protein